MKLVKNSFLGILLLSISLLSGEDHIEPLRPTELLYEEQHQDYSYLQYNGKHLGSEAEGNSSAQSGYRAFYHGILSLKFPLASKEERSNLIQKIELKSADDLFGHEESLWRAKVIEQRKKSILVKYILNKYSDTLLAGKFLNHLDPGSWEEELFWIAYYAAQIVAQAHINEKSFTVTSEDLCAAFKQVAQDKKDTSGRTFDIRALEKDFARFKPFTAEIRANKNSIEIYEGKERISLSRYGPPDNKGHILDGSWLTSTDLSYLAQRELNKPSEHLANFIEKDTAVHFLQFNVNSADPLVNLYEIEWLLVELRKNAPTFKVLYLLNCSNEWISCLITKSEKKVTFIVIDPQNKDRREEEGLRMLTKIVQEALSPEKLSHENKKAVQRRVDEEEKNNTPNRSVQGNPQQTQFFNTHKGSALRTQGATHKETNEGARNYDAPLANVPDSDIPSLEELFGNKIPNSIRMLIKQMKKQEAQGSSSTKLKNCLLLYGPPGTGKSTIAQVMARAAGKNIMYAGGGDFRTAMQGSGTELLEALFAEAKQRGNCVVIIDEIDGASSRLQPHSSTQEDNRALKKLITILDQFRYDPDIFVICTTNYAEDIDPAVLRRLKCVEIGLPDYIKRKNIINYYFKKNSIVVASRRSDAVSPDFYNKLISATKEFSGDAIGEMINTAIFEFKEDLEPEFKINLDFRTQGIDLYNKSILENIGELALLSLTPLFMMIGESDLDKHLYSAYIRQVKLNDDLKKKERKKDTLDKYAKDPVLTRFAKRNFDNATHALEQNFWNILSQACWQKLLKKLS
jgi:SpoVK/Ycf46/Vps4 family AAA+-type ATPase